MTRVVRLARDTRRQRRRWWAGAVSATAGAGGLAIAAGGSSLWLRVVLAGVALERCHASMRHRTSITPFVVAVVVALAMVPVDAAVERTVVTAIGGVLVVTAAECAHVARRLVTVTPVPETGRDLAAVASAVGAAAFAIAITVTVAQLGRWSAPGFVVGAIVAAVGIAALAATPRPEQPPRVTDGG